jgi:hypothetical protein
VSPVRRRPHRLRQAAAAGWAALALPLPALADPGYYVVTPYANEGVRTVDFRYWTVKFDGRPTLIWPEVGFGYGVTSRWTTEVFVSWIGSSQSATRASSFNWQNDFLLTQGEFPVDVALHAQWVRNLDDTYSDALEFGPVLQTDVGRTQLNFNVFLDRSLGDGPRRPTALKYQWQVRHRALRGLHFGVQGFGEVGPWDDWMPRQQQSHRAGPAVFGTLRFADRQVLKAQAALLFGKVNSRDARMFTARVAYDF